MTLKLYVHTTKFANLQAVAECRSILSEERSGDQFLELGIGLTQIQTCT